MMTGTPAVALEPGGEGEPGVDAGHHEVGDDQVRRLGVDARLRLDGIGGGDHAVAGSLEDEAVDLEEVEVVVDDEDLLLVLRAHGSLSV